MKRPMVLAVVLTALTSGCVPDQATEPGRVIRVNRNLASPAGEHFFVAWTYSIPFQTNPIQPQVETLEPAEYREYTSGASSDVLSFAAANPGHLYIDGDEPDQSCTSPAAYAASYHDFVAAIRSADATAHFSPAGFAEPNDACCPPATSCHSDMHSIGYAQQFYDAYVGDYGIAPPVDEWRFHDFGLDFNGDLPSWWSRVQSEAAWSVSHGANMVLGSWGFLWWTVDQPTFLSDMRQAMDLLENDSRINQAAWWSYENTGTSHYLQNSDGTLTAEGNQYTQDPGVLSASISGPTRLAPGVACQWTASVSGGAAPLAYSWTVNGSVIDTSNPFSYTNTGSSFTLGLQVVDEFGVSASTSETVRVTSPGPDCPM